MTALSDARLWARVALNLAAWIGLSFLSCIVFVRGAGWWAVAAVTLFVIAQVPFRRSWDAHDELRRRAVTR